jgi:hypothetical protein
MTTTSQAPAVTATAKQEVPKASAPVVQSMPVNPYTDDPKYAQFKVVNLRLLKPGTIQYDPNYPELVLNTSDKEGMPLPLTPFFSSRINQTLELVL